MRHDFAHSNLRDRASAVQKYAKLKQLSAFLVLRNGAGSDVSRRTLDKAVDEAPLTGASFETPGSASLLRMKGLAAAPVPKTEAKPLHGLG
jgi:hypothetical protein